MGCAFVLSVGKDWMRHYFINTILIAGVLCARGSPERAEDRERQDEEECEPLHAVRLGRTPTEPASIGHAHS